ncbi:PREDICTED: semaphorin-1A-like [Nicrophorus vespilloides]|uniref:Semaphorin-1A-like n=1 Tax=Nicrophorus vespilloides TaxID=110193 RepID=A0ABM1NGW5_NICVS|nr:PREDICTED: semaphorin-1A-like [Nicrophorus vespilloides]
MLNAWRRSARSHEVLMYLIIIIAVVTSCHAWSPDNSQKVINEISKLRTIKFAGNATYPDHFIILNQDAHSILLGGRNHIYNLSVYDFSEIKDSRIEWQSSEAISEMCSVKGKSEDDCQNYIRIYVETEPGQHLICGTNSYKPCCRHYAHVNGKYTVVKEVEGIGVCPYNPEHNSTAVYSKGQMYSATVADFSGGDPLIYRQPQRTEYSDLKQLNAPNFVSSVPYGDFIFFFFRETAVEYINCGKVIYSRVARVCKDDKGGPHQFRNGWTTFLKTRLNCSVPGEYPFYFDEIQSTSEIIEGKYGTDLSSHIIYGILTTPSNAIGGSAICAYNMNDVLESFEGSFKHQDSINANWLPVSKDKVPEPRPGQCVRDSRLLQENHVNFIKTHPLMENAVPAMFGKPLLIRVNFHYRLTAVVVDSQVKTVNDEVFDVLYVGTDNGRVLKVVNIPTVNETAKTVVISENVILPNGAAVKQLKIAPGFGSVVVVGRDEVRLAKLNHCSAQRNCRECVHLQDPHCAWNTRLETCISLDEVRHNTKRDLIQDILRGDESKCRSPQDTRKMSPKIIVPNDIDNDIGSEIEEDDDDDSQDDPSVGEECEDSDDGNNINCAVKQKLVIYTAETLQISVIVAAVVSLLLGFIVGYIFSRRFHPPSQYPDTPFIEQRNHLEGLSGTQSNFLSRPKTINHVINSLPPPPKKDNLDASKDHNIANDGTLQKIKKTYI